MVNVIDLSINNWLEQKTLKSHALILILRTFRVVVQRLQQKLLMSCNNYILEALNDTKRFPRRAINVIGDPVKRAIAEFHRVNTNQYGSVSEKNLVGKIWRF